MLLCHGFIVKKQYVAFSQSSRNKDFRPKIFKEKIYICNLDLLLKPLGIVK